MKKTYQKPATTIVMVQTQNMMVQSLEVSKESVTTASGAEARSYKFDVWGDDDSEGEE